MTSWEVAVVQADFAAHMIGGDSEGDPRCVAVLDLRR